MNFSLIIPAAADKLEYKIRMPQIFNLNDEGIMLCVKAILGLELDKFDSIYFVILKSQSEKYCLKEMFDVQFKRFGLLKAKVVVLDHPTISQAETVYNTLIMENLSGSIYIKDADCYFNSEVIQQNGVAIYPLEKLEVVRPQNKSYVSVDEMFYVTNIIEKRIVSHFFNAGGYVFENVEEFKRQYEILRELSKQFYLSHIIYKMLLERISFRPTLIKDYIDFENLK